MASAGPFRFLDLPNELRLRVYDLLPVETRWHTITVDHQGAECSVSIESKRTRQQLIATCRHINSELSNHRKKYPSTPERLNVVADWRAIRSTILRTILRCAVSRDVDADKCKNPESLATGLAPLHIPGRPSQSSALSRGSPIFRHEQLHDILRHSVSARSPVIIGFSIHDPELTKVVEHEVSLVNKHVWYAELQEGEQAMQIVLQCRLKDEARD